MDTSHTQQVILITGSSRGIGLYLTHYYLNAGHIVIGCSRSELSIEHQNYQHFSLDVASEIDVKSLFSSIRKRHKRLDVLINNAGIAAMNHAMLTPLSTVEKIFSTNVFASFLFCREAVKLMRKNQYGRIVNFSTVAVPFALEGEAIYAASKSAVESLTQTLAKEFSEFGVTVNAIGPTPIQTDLIKNVPDDKLNKLLEKQSIKRFGEMADVSNVIDFYIKPESSFITGQILYLGGA
ncbi:Oxidoreductase [Alteromonas sp. 38]|uniref:SDR family NAD(P)-dependent oxidoreductase n=1 Tax=Alteromonas TaxID=226 RepID=UPI0012F3D1D1|nr:MULTISPECIES: SDR family oxidoreductase [Alteromonas]CAD5285917.1 Oxidoreductase [Alteromonas sp. 154]VXB35664.1 Oxidoreductase [Alteromonas sp. 38]